MIIPSIDIMNGRAVQLIGGKEFALDGGDPLEVAARFSRAGEIAVIDLDAALGQGDNQEIIRQIIRRYPCRVGGGIRSVEAAREWLDQGAETVILGTAAQPEVLKQLPRDRVCAALDGKHGQVAVKGWTECTGATILEKIEELKPYVGSFLVTFIEKEGRLGGIDLESSRRVAQAAKGNRLTLAGGITTAEEIATLDALGADSQVGMALYTGKLPLAEAFAGPLTSDRRDGLWPTVVCDVDGRALGLAYSNAESLHLALEEGRGIYWSRSRAELWRKGDTSGATQDLIRVQADCDRDTLRFTVRQEGTGFCHQQTRSCWGEDWSLRTLEQILRERISGEDPHSYTARVANDPALLAAKLREEAQELGEAQTADEVRWEAADLLYFTLVRAVKENLSLRDLQEELRRRHQKTRRRDGSLQGGLS